MTDAPTRVPRLRRGITKAVAAGVATVIALGGAILATTPAIGATGGTGYGSFDNSPWEPYKGTFNHNGMLIVCAEVGRPLPQGDTLQNPVLAGLGDIAGLSSKWGEHPNISSNQLAGINRVLNEHAGTGDRAEAAGLEYAIANVLYPDNSLYTIAGTKMSSLDETINYDMYTPSGGNVGAIQNWAHTLINDINSTPAASNATGSGQLNFNVDLTAYPVKGTVTMAGTAGSVGSITLTNAVFSNGSATLSGVTAGQVLDITGAPPADGSPYQISGTGSFTPPGGGGYLPQVSLLRAKADVQSSIGAGPRATATPFNVQGVDPNLIAQTFNPILSTSAVQYVEVGQKPTDQVTFGTGPNSAGVNVPWPTVGGKYAPISAKGTLYGPFSTEPAQSPNVPAGAPVAGHASVTASQENGPNVSYTAESDTAVTATGFYTWVWEINAADQRDTVKKFLTADYAWHDDFGQKVETSLMPMYPELTSTVNKRIVAPGENVTDHLNIYNSTGVWLPGVSATFTGKAYSVESGTAPTTAASVPAGATPFATVNVTVTKPGEVDSPAVTVPQNAGHIVWVWSFDANAQADPTRFGKNYTWQDQWALSAETSVVQFKPALTSKVSSHVVQVGDVLNDRITTSVAEGQWIDGTNVVANGTLYGPLAKPATESATVPNGTPVAGVTTLNLTGIGTFETDSKIVAKASGYYVWVWSIEQAVQTGTASQLIPAGYKFVDRFGLADETSVVPMSPELTSKVNQAIVAAGQKVTDHLTVRNASGEWLAGVDAKFTGKAYSITSGDKPATAESIPAGLAPFATVEVTVNKAGEVDSPTVTVPNDAGYIVWVWSFDSAAQDDPSLFAAGYTWQDKWALDDETSVAQFKPVVTTQVSSKIVKLGQEINDIVTTSVVQGQWVKGTKVTAQGTLYGPFLAQPDQSATVPSWAPIAGTAELTFDGVKSIETKSGIIASESGYYTWVWEIHQDKQKGRALELIPDGYSFVDDFAQIPETSITPSGIIAESAVVKPEVALGEETQDTLTVRLNGDGGWLQVGRDRIPVTFRGTAYWIGGDKAPEVSATVPAEAVALGTTFITASKPGTYVSEKVTGEDYRAGWITWVWEIRDEDQPENIRGMVAEWSDGFGLPSETQRILMPKVTTKATPEANIAADFEDVAKVTGTMPVKGADLHFELYSAVKDEAGNWVCEAGNLLWTSETKHIAKTGEYRSGPTFVEKPGDYFWVEVLTSVNGNEISRGICGLPDETTTVVPPKVTTKAQTDVAIGEPFTDTAIVEGKLPATEDKAFELHFELYAATKDDNGAWVCDAGNLLWTSSTQKVWGDKSEYTSPEAPGQLAGTYHWVEVLTYKGEEVHRGVCGLPDETTTVIAPEVTTKAQAGAKKGESIQDTAIVTGPIPKSGAELTFEAYNIPMVQDGDRWVPNRPEGVDPADWSWVATPENLIGDNLAEGEIITEAGEYLSPKFVANEYGKVLWVETLWTIPAENPEFVDEDGDGKDDVTGEPKAERQVIHRGEIGIPNETSFIVDVSTVATSDNGQTDGVEHGVKVWDTAQLVGYVPENGTVEFEAYLVPDSVKGDITKACTQDTLAWTSPKVVVEGGLYTADKPLLVTGEAHVFDPDVDSQLYWVEVTRDELGREVSRGVCGDDSETVGLKGQRVIRTDGELPVMVIGGIALLAALGAAGAVIATRRRKSTS